MGYTCALCGVWVPDGMFHTCYFIQHVPQIAVSPTLCMYCAWATKCNKAIKPQCFQPIESVEVIDVEEVKRTGYYCPKCLCPVDDPIAGQRTICRKCGYGKEEEK